MRTLKELSIVFILFFVLKSFVSPDFTSLQKAYADGSNKPRAGVEKIEQRLDLSEYAYGGQKLPVITNFDLTSLEEVRAALNKLEEVTRGKGFLKIEDNRILFAKLDGGFVFENVEIKNGWEQEFNIKAYRWAELYRGSQSTTPWFDIIKQRKAERGQKNQEKKEVVGMPKIPVIKFENNPRSQEELKAMAKILETFKDKTLEGVDISKIEGKQEYKDYLQTIYELLNDKSLYSYLSSAEPVQLRAVEIEINGYIKGLYILSKNFKSN